MNPSLSIACDATFGAGSENFGTVTGNVTFQDGSANSGTVTGNAVFEGTAENKAGAIVTGNATFAEGTAVNNGTVNGSVVMTGQFATWLAANSGVNQYNGAGSKHGQWAYNSTEYASEAAASAAAYAAAAEAAYQFWLAANVGAGMYAVEGSHYGQWAYNGVEYASEEEAQAQAAAKALSAAYSGVGDGDTGISGVYYLVGHSDGSQWTAAQIKAVSLNSVAPTVAQLQAIPASQFAQLTLSIVDAYVSEKGHNCNTFTPTQWLAFFPGKIGVGTYGYYDVFVNSNHYTWNLEGVPSNGTIQTGVTSVQDSWPKIYDENLLEINDPNWTPTFHDEPSYTLFVNGYPV
jgi:hypothetical protein